MPEMTDQHQNTAGSVASIEPAYVLIGKFQRTNGVRGEINMPYYLFSELIRRGKIIYVGSEYQARKVIATRWKNNLMLLKLEGYDNLESARELTGKDVFAAVKDLPSLPEGRYYHHQLVGLTVWEGEEKLGVLAAIMETGANEVYIIDQPDGKELLIPAIPEVIQKVDLDQKRLEVRLLEGLRG